RPGGSPVGRLGDGIRAAQTYSHTTRRRGAEDGLGTKSERRFALVQPGPTPPAIGGPGERSTADHARRCSRTGNCCETGPPRGPLAEPLGAAVGGPDCNELF